jgi:hypothetical protein
MTILAPLVAALLCAEGGERFESFSYAPPPAAWSVLDLGAEGRRYVRQEENGNGLVVLVPGQPSTGSPADDYAAMWRARASAIVAGPPPEPTVRRDGEFTVLTGTRKVVSEGQQVVATVIAFVGGGRASGIAGVATGDAVLPEVTAVLDSVRLAPAAGMAAGGFAAAPSGGAAALEFDVPRGYLERPESTKILLLPEIFDARTPCLYGIAAPRRAGTSLEADADVALVELVVPGWQRQDERRRAMRGTSATGWPYVWVRGTFRRTEGGNTESRMGMAMALPAGPDRVHVVFGHGDPGRCHLHDAPFEQLFHSLQPVGWKSDGGKALGRDVLGAWRSTEATGGQHLILSADGRYQRKAGAVLAAGTGGSGEPGVARGRYALRGSELLLMPDSHPERADRYRVRVYDSARGTAWKRSMALLDEHTSPAVVLWWSRIDEPAR